MKKFAFLLIFFILLGAAAWGQAGITYTWTGLSSTDPTDWNDSDNWDIGSGFPGNDPSDAVIFNTTGTYPTSPDPIIITTPLGEDLLSLTIDTGVNLILDTGTLTTEDLILNGNLTVSGTLDIMNLKTNSAAVVTGTVTMYGASVAVTATDVTITGVNNNTGILDVSNKVVTISTNTGNTPISIGAIPISGTKTFNVDGIRTLDISSNVFNTITVVSSTAIITLINNGLDCGTLNNNGTLDIVGYNIINAAAINNAAGTLRLTGASGQTVSLATIYGIVEFYDANETNFAGITRFENITISEGDRVTSAALTVDGNLTIENGASLEITNNITFNGTTWDNQNTIAGFKATAGTVEFTSANAVVNGDNTFYDVDVMGASIRFNDENTITLLDVGSGNTAIFASGKEQKIATLRLENGSIIASTVTGTVLPANRWNLDGTIVLPAVLTPSNLPRINDCNSINYVHNFRPGIDAIYSGANYGNTHNVFFDGKYTWTGNASSVWNAPGNWVANIFPAINDGTAEILIPQLAYNPNNTAVPYYPVFNDDVTCLSLEIEDDAIIDLGNYILTITGTSANALINDGTIMLHGVTNQVEVNSSSPVNIGGTIHYHNNTAAEWVFGNSYVNLTVANTVSMINTTSLSVSGDATIGATAANLGITTTGAQSYGSLALTSAVTLKGSQVTINGAIDGSSSNFALTINGLAVGNADAVFNGGSNIGVLMVDGNAQFNTALLEAASVTVDGTSAINANITTTTTQTYSGAITLGGAAAVTQITLTGTSVTLGAITNGNGKDLTITHGTPPGNAIVELNGASNIKDLSVEGNATINANITTTGNQTYTGTVILNGAVSMLRTLESSGGEIEVAGVVSGSVDLTVNASSGINLSAQNTVSGDISLNNIRGTATGEIVYSSKLATATDNLTISAINNATTGGNITITEATGNIVIPVGSPSISTNTQLGVVSLTATAGSITVNGGIGNGNGIVRLKSGVGGITVGNAINCYRLTLDAGGVGNVAINNSITVSSNNKTNHYDNIATNQSAAVYINANTFNGNGNINLLGTIGWVCVDFSSRNYTGTVTNKNIHYHPDKTKPIIYKTGTDPNPVPGFTVNSYTYIQADDLTWDNPLNLSASGNNDFYIIDVPQDGSIANTRDVEFSTIGGAIEIRGAYNSSAKFNLNAGTGGIKLNGANINLSDDSFDTKGAKIELLGNSSAIVSTSDDILINDINSNTGTQNLTLTAKDITIDGTAGVQSNINGSLTIENSGNFTLATGSDITLTNGSFTQNSTNAVSSSTTLAGSITTTGTGTTILFDDLVTISGVTNLTTAGGNITFDREIIGAVDGSGAPVGELTLNAAGAAVNSLNITKTIGFDTTPVPKDLNDEIIGNPAYLKKFHVVSTGLNLSADVYAAEMVFNQDFNTPASNYITLAVPKATGGKIQIDRLQGGMVELKGGSYNPNYHGDNALNFIQSTNSKFDYLRIAKSSYIRIQDQLSFIHGTELVLSAGTPATTLDLFQMNLANWNPITELILEGRSKQESSRVIFKDNMGHFLSTFDYKTRDPDNYAAKGWAHVQSLGSNIDITAISNQNILDSIANPQLILEMQGAMAKDLITNDMPIGSLHIYSPTTLNGELIINGELKISNVGTASGTLNAGTNDITMRAGLTGKRDISNYTHNGNTDVKYARWEIETNSLDINNLNASIANFPFKQNANNKVIFKRSNPSDTNVFFEIAGNTMWQNFVCEEPGAVVQFSTHPNHHVFLEEFIIKNNSNIDSRPITLTRLPTDNDWVYIFNPNSSLTPPTTNATSTVGLPINPVPRNLKADSAQNIKFWNFNLVTSSAIADQITLENVQIYFSHAWLQRIPISITDSKFSIYPYYKASPKMGYFNCDWGLELYTIIYSFAEDSNGNGKVDRIRVQSNVVLNKDFSDFAVEVELDGKKITYDTSGSFEVVGDVTLDPYDYASFYININEPPSIYDGKPLKWRIIRNESLMDQVTRRVLIGEYGGFERSYYTTNTIPPRISYAVTLPEHNQTFFRFSQPVNEIKGGTVGGNAAGLPYPVEPIQSYKEILKYFGRGEDYKATVPKGAFGYWFEINSFPTIDKLAALPSNRVGINPATDIYFTAKDFEGTSVGALDWNDNKIDKEFYAYYPPPRYPKDWKYKNYETYAGNSHIDSSHGLSPDVNTALRDTVFVPPFKALTPQMVRDLEGTGNVEPGDFNYSNINDPDLMRRSTDILVSIDQDSDTDDRYFVLPVYAEHATQLNPPVENKRIFDFNGTKFLEARGPVDLQVKKNSLFGNPEIFWTNDIGVDFRNRNEAPVKGKNVGGLWHPNLGTLDPLYNIAPKLAQISGAPMTVSDPSSPNLLDYTFNGNLESGKKVEFMFRIPEAPDMFIAYLDKPKGAVIPPDWYLRVRPFSFDIQDPRPQRGGVTIMNNVINSEKKEKTYLRYHLVRSGRVTIQVYTLDGSLVKSIRRNEQRTAGEWTDTWDGTNAGGRSVARGMYFIRIVGPDIDEIRKVMVVK